MEDVRLGWHPNMIKLVQHLRRGFYFGLPQRPMSASKAKRLVTKCERLKDHEFSTMALAADAYDKRYKRHKVLQDYFMANQRYTIAMEAPVWDDEMCTLLDLLLIDPKTGIVDLLDYKPDAAKEKKAGTQIYHGKRLLCNNTGIKPEFIRAFYFDEHNTYQLIS